MGEKQEVVKEDKDRSFVFSESMLDEFISKQIDLRQEGETNDVLLASHEASASVPLGRGSPASKESYNFLIVYYTSLKYNITSNISP